MFEKRMDTKPLSSPPEPATPDASQAGSSSSLPGTSNTSAADPQPQILPPSQTLTPASEREVPLRDIFVGPRGVYPGIRWLLYLAIAFVVYLLVQWLTQQFRAANAGSLAAALSWEISVLLAAVLPALVMARLEQRSLADFGLPLRSAFGGNFWAGSLWGMVSLTVLMIVLRLAGAFEFGSLSLHGSRILKYALYYGAFFLATGITEEFLLRGYSLWVLAQGMSFWPAAALTSVLFGAVHSLNSGENIAGLLAAGLIGFLFCLTLRRTGSLWWAIGFHMAWDWGESFLYSVPDSGGVSPGHLLRSSIHGPAWLTGGPVGPEGSYLIFVLLAVLWVLFDRTHPQVKYEPR
jgi:membrane protease YdiL (CAAX protease family)